MIFRNRFIFRPRRTIEATPDSVGLDHEDVSLRAADGVLLHAWFLPAEEADLTVLWLHGNAGNVGHRVREAQQLHRLGASILLLEYRGYGRSEGRASEEGLYRDAAAALAWLEDVRGVPRERIVLYGRSLGCAVAADLAVRNPGLAGMALITPFSSLRDVAPNFLPIPGVRWLAGKGFDVVARMARVTCPVLVVAGDADVLTPPWMAKRIVAVAPDRCELRIVRGGGHESTHLEPSDGALGFAPSLVEFLASI